MALVREGGPHRKQLAGSGGEGGIFWDTRRVPLFPPISLFWGVTLRKGSPIDRRRARPLADNW